MAVAGCDPAVGASVPGVGARPSSPGSPLEGGNDPPAALHATVTPATGSPLSSVTSTPMGLASACPAGALWLLPPAMASTAASGGGLGSLLLQVMVAPASTSVPNLENSVERVMHHLVERIGAASGPGCESDKECRNRA